MMTQEEIIKIIREEMDLGPEVSVTPDTTLESLGVDSAEFVDIVVKCGVPEEKEVGIETVGDIVKAVCA
jgi:acyl carrier protein